MFPMSCPHHHPLDLHESTLKLRINTIPENYEASLLSPLIPLLDTYVRVTTLKFLLDLPSECRIPWLFPLSYVSAPGHFLDIVKGLVNSCIKSHIAAKRQNSSPDFGLMSQ